MKVLNLLTKIIIKKGNMKNKIFDLCKKAYKDSLIKNSIYLIASNLSSLALGFVFWMIAARYYTPHDVGIISAVLSSVFLISMISLIGLPMSLTLYLPLYRKDANKIINSSLMVGIGISAIFSLIYVVGIDIWSPKLRPALGNLELVVIFIITTIMMTVSSLMSSMFTAGKRSSFHMIKENIFGAVRIFFIVLLSGLGAVGIFVSWSVSIAITMMIGFFLLYKLWKYVPTPKFDPIIKEMAEFSGGNYIAGLLYNIPRFVFPIMIANMISPESAGYFFIAMTIAGVFYGVPEAIAGPFLVESSDKDRFWKNVNNAIKFIIAILIPGLLILAIFGKYILNAFSPNYADNSLTTVVILSATSIPLSLIIVFNMIRNAQKKVVWSIISNGVITAITMLLAIPFMKIWDIEGVALAYFIANTIMAIIIVFFIDSPIMFALRLLKSEKTKDGKDNIDMTDGQDGKDNMDGKDEKGGENVVSI